MGIKSAPGVVLLLIINQFNGNYSNDLIQLGWITYSEVNLDHFDAERSTGGVNFRQLSSVTTVSGQLKSYINYNYLDITAERALIITGLPWLIITAIIPVANQLWLMLMLKA